MATLDANYRSDKWESQSIYTNGEVTAINYDGVQAGIMLYRAVPSFNDMPEGGGYKVKPWLITHSEIFGSTYARSLEIGKGVYDIKVHGDFILEPDAGTVEGASFPFGLGWGGGQPWYTDPRGLGGILQGPYQTFVMPGTLPINLRYGMDWDLRDIEFTQDSAGMWFNAWIYTAALSYNPNMRFYGNVDIRRHPDSEEAATTMATDVSHKVAHRLK